MIGSGRISCLAAMIMTVISVYAHTVDEYHVCSDSWNMIQLKSGHDISFCWDAPAGMRIFGESSSILWNPGADQVGIHRLPYCSSFKGTVVTNSITINVKRLEKVLCVLAHSDDEFGICAKIKRMRDSGVDVSFVWTSLHSQLRIEESRSAMRRVGINDDSMHFLNAGNIVSPVGFHGYVNKIMELLKSHNFDQIYIPAYEGGHVQHDLTHAATIAACRQYGFKGQIYEFGLYHLEGVHPMLFSLLPGPSPSIQLNLDKETRGFIEDLSESYLSQKSVTTGFRLGMSNRKKAHPVYRPLPDWDYTRPPHGGILWYTANFKHPASYANDFSPAVKSEKVLLPVAGKMQCYAQDIRKSEIGELLLPDRKGDKTIRVSFPLSVYAYSTFILFFAGLGGLIWKGIRVGIKRAESVKCKTTNGTDDIGGCNA